MKHVIVLAALVSAGCAGLGRGTMTSGEGKGPVTMRGKAVVLQGGRVEIGGHAPDFRVVDSAFKPVQLADFAGKVCLIAAVPSLDTPVCSLETKRFNEEAAKLPNDVVVMTISMDLPFAQKRFCTAEKVDRIYVFSDHVWTEFGLAYGVLIKDMGLLARSVFVVDKDGRLVYRQVVPEVTSEPDYDSALSAARQASAQPARKRARTPPSNGKRLLLGG